VIHLRSSLFAVALFSLLSAAACNSGSAPDAATCPNAPVAMGEACEPAQAGLVCPSTFAPDCTGAFQRLFCTCQGASWVCDSGVCTDASADAAADASRD
jgi:hypothetical protein